jgi:hypothetical protein
MAEAGTMCINADVIKKAGDGASSTSTAEAYTNEYILQAESFINCVTRHNFTTGYAGLNVAVKYLLKEAASNLAAIYAITYDMSGYTSISRAELLVNINWIRFKQCMRLLMEQKTITFMKGL